MSKVKIIPISFPSHDAKSECRGQIWKAEPLEGKPRGIIQIVHGMAEHIKRYDDLARYFVGLGYVVCGIDHIGHGDTAPTKADWGVMPINGGAQILVDDAHEVRLTMQLSYGEDVPYFMYGHSMGSFVVRMYISQYGKGLNGAIISGTGHNPVAVCRTGLTLARRIATHRGIAYQSKMLHNLADGAYSGAIKNARTKFDWLSHDEAIVDAYIADEASGFPFKAGGYSTLMELCDYIARQRNIDTVPHDLPILFIAGNEDPVGSNGKGVTAVYSLFRKAQITDVTLKLYDGMRHEVHNEIGHEQVYEDVARWIADRIDAAADPDPAHAGYLIAIDQGTTSSRSLLIDAQGRTVASFQEAFPQIYPQPGWVEHNPFLIWQSVEKTLNDLAYSPKADIARIGAIGITNQRETTMIWNRETSEPIANAIVWQCRRTAEMVEEICGDPEVAAKIKAKTGLLPDAYFSASKIKWLLDSTPGAWDDAQAGKLAFGTVDTWLLWKLTDGAVHATDYTNASRTMLFNIHTLTWDEWLLDLFGIPASLLPEVHPSAHDYGRVANGPLKGVRITSLVGDQQAALFGQCCFESGQAKATYGTGCFLLVNTGAEACESTHGLLTTIAASAPAGREGAAPAVTYALEGSVLNCGTLIQWLRDNMGIISESSETNELAESVEDSAGVYIVPAFTGLGAPYWDPNARGAVLGLTRGSTKAHLCRAALEAIAFQNHDLVKAMEADAKQPIHLINVDGGVSNNGFCMQFQSDILQTTLKRPASVETTALGAAFLAGLQTGFYPDTDYLLGLRKDDTVFTPQMDDATRKQALEGWRAAIARVM